MPTKFHFIDVGQGNMTLLQLANGKIMLYDCNLTQENKNHVLNYIAKHIGSNKSIDYFVCSHRDSDHMRGIEIIHKYFPIQHVWDSGMVGTTTDSSEYRQYMTLRRQIGFTELAWKTRYDFGNTRLRIFNSKNDDLSNNANAQSIVIKAIHRDSKNDKDHASVLLTGDTDAATWKYLQKHYDDADLSCSLLLASHHGSLSYFDDPNDDKYYLKHLLAKSPDMTIISVGNNAHGHPAKKSIELYEKYSTGSDAGTKILRTDKNGHICLELKDNGGWTTTNTPSTANGKISSYA